MKKAIGMFAALILALGMSGLAYAHWSQTIYIEGSVETGTVCVGWLDVDYEDYEYLYKDVGEVDAWLEDLKGWHIEDPIYETLVVELNNVYPSYEAYIYVEIANGGTIPVNLNDCDIYPVSDPDDLIRFVDCWVDEDYWPDYPQLDPCDTAWAVIGIHIMQEVWDEGLGEWVTCPEDATATFAGYLTFDQWNYTP